VSKKLRPRIAASIEQKSPPAREGLRASWARADILEQYGRRVAALPRDLSCAGVCDPWVAAPARRISSGSKTQSIGAALDLVDALLVPRVVWIDVQKAFSSASHAL